MAILYIYNNDTDVSYPEIYREPQLQIQKHDNYNNLTRQVVGGCVSKLHQFFCKYVNMSVPFEIWGRKECV